MAKTNGKLSMEEFTKIAVLHGQSVNAAKAKAEGKEPKLGIFGNAGYFKGFLAYYGEAPYKYDKRTKKYTGYLPEACAKGKFDGHPVGSGTWIIYLKGQAPVGKASKAVEDEANAILKLVAKAAKA